VKICVVQWRRKGKETESWNFFGGFVVAGVGLSEWVACGWRKWGMWRQMQMRIKKRIVALASSSPGFGWCRSSKPQAAEPRCHCQRRSIELVQDSNLDGLPF
jgi:hypothetical protein